LASTKPTETENKQESKCPSCGKPMAADQRYCMECGNRRADPRVDFRRQLFADGDEGARATGGRGWNPLAAAALLGLLGIALLVGVLIGKDENDEQPAATTPAAQTTPTTAAPPTATTPPTTTTPPGIAPGGSATTPPPAGSGAESGGATQPGGTDSGGGSAQSTPTQPEGEGRVTPP
jgi:hypothetical protein